MKINLTEADVFFALCKAIREKQDEGVRYPEGNAVHYSEIGNVLLRKFDAKSGDIYDKQVYAIIRSLIEKDLIKKKGIQKVIRRGKVLTTYFELSDKGKIYIQKLKEKA